MLVSFDTIPAQKRRNVLKMLCQISKDLETSRIIESAIHSVSRQEAEYIDKAQQLIFNIKQNPALIENKENTLLLTDDEMAKNTVIEDIQHETELRKTRFEQMLQEKYDMVNDKSYNTTLKCRRCGSAEVSWEQKQTRSADEASTVFCTCNKCNNRWTMR